jgi:hypothetical protein
MTAAFEKRAGLLLDLARRQTAAFPGWLVLKNLDSALEGRGDLDAIAPARNWDGIEASFRAWAGDHRLEPVVVCRHSPSGPYLFALEPSATELLVLDVKRRRAFRTGHLFSSDDLLPMAIMDPRGIRLLRPGAEGVLKFVWNGIGYCGRRQAEGLRRKHVREHLVADPTGVRMASRLFGRAAPDLRRAIGAFLAGGWDRRAATRVELHYLAKGLANPRLLARRVWLVLVQKRQCPALAATRGRGPAGPADMEDWFRRVARGHEVTGSAPSSSP